jgi:Zn-dependent protease
MIWGGYAGVMLAAVDFANPLLWAVFIGWIMSVVLHEFAHGLVAHWGGDYTVRERGGLTLNPLQYVDPLMSIVLPVVVFLIGGVPLPGGVTYVRHDLLRSRAWSAAVSAAGPVMNLLLFLGLILPFHPRFGWIDAPRPTEASNAMLFMGCMAWLQMLSVLLNLIPIPPLDGFGIASAFMEERTRQRFLTPPLNYGLFLALFLLAKPIGVFDAFHVAIAQVLLRLGFDPWTILFFARSYNLALYGHP